MNKDSGDINYTCRRIPVRVVLIYMSGVLVSGSSKSLVGSSSGNVICYAVVSNVDIAVEDIVHKVDY